MSQYIRKFAEGGDTTTLKKKFKTASNEYDADLLASNFENNLIDYANIIGLKQGSDEYNQLLEEAGKIQKGIKDGTFSRGDGLKYTGSIISDNNLAQSRALGLLDTILANSTPEGKEEKKEEEKKAFDINGLRTFFNNKFFGGQESPDLQSWLDKDVLDETTGKRANTNRSAALADMLDEYATSLNGSNYDFTGTAHNSLEDYQSKLRNAATSLRDGTYNNNDASALDAIGWGATLQNQLLGEGDAEVKEKEKTNFETELENYRKELELNGAYTEDQINQMVKAKAQNLRNLAQKEYSDSTLSQNWSDYANKTFTKAQKLQTDLDLSRAFGDDFWLGKTAEGKGEDIPSFFLSNSNKVDNVWNTFIKNGVINNNITQFNNKDVKDSDILRAKIHYDIQNGDKGYTKLENNKNEYIINDTVTDTGLAWVYDAGTGKLTRISADRVKTPTLNKILKDRWLKNREVTSDTSAQWMKLGGKAEILKSLRKPILFAMTGTELANLSKKKLDSEKKEIENKAKEQGRTYKQYRAGHRHISKDTHDNWEITELDTSDRARLAGISADLIGLATSFTGAGTITNAVTGLGSLGANLIADIKDDSMSTGEVVGNTAMNLGLGLVGFLPGGNTFKLIKNIAKIAPKMLALYDAGKLAMDPNVRKSWEKTLHSGDENRLTVDDFKNIAHSITALRSVTHIGTNAYKSHNYAKETGKTLIKNSTKSDTASQLAENASKTDKAIAKATDLAKNTKSGITGWIKNKIAPGYEYPDQNKINAFKESHKINLKTSLLETLKGKGRWSDAAMWARMQGKEFNSTNLNNQKSVITQENPVTKPQFNNPIDEENETIVISENPVNKITNGINKLDEIKGLNALKAELEYKGIPINNMANLIKFNDILLKNKLDVRGISRNRWLAIKKENKFKKGGIIKAQQGSIADWYTKRYKLLYLTDWSADKDESLAGDNLNHNLFHHKYGDLTGAYNTNQAYTSNSDLVGSDLQTYYNNKYKGKSIDDYITAYNNDADIIRGRWLRDDIKYNDKDAASHNQLFKLMFTARSGNTNNDYDLGYSVSTEPIQGSTTWMRRMDQYENEFDNLDDNAKKSRIHSIDLGNGNIGYVYKTSNGNIAKLDPEEAKRILNLQTPESDSKNTPEEKANELAHVTGINTGNSSTNTSILNKFKQELPNLINDETVANSWAIGRYLSNLKNNRDILNIMSRLRNPLKGFDTGHLSVRDAHDLMLATQASVNNMKSLAHKSKTSDAALNLAHDYEVNQQANEALNKAALLNHETIRTSEALLLALDREINKYNLNVRDFNQASLAEQYNLYLKTLNAYKTAKLLNFNTFSMELELRARTNAADKKNKLLSLLTMALNNKLLQKLANDPTYAKMLADITKRTDTDSDSYALAVSALKIYALQFLDKLADLQVEGLANIYGINLNNVYTNKLKELRGNTTFNPVIREKSGGKVETTTKTKTDTSEIRKKEKDHDRLVKQVLESMKTTEKSLDRLSKLLLLAIQKQLGTWK